MSSPLDRFAFVDSVIAAEVLHVTQDTVLDWIREGKLRAVGGKPSNPFLRSADVAILVTELGVARDEAPKRSKSPSARVQQRITADSRWSEITADDISEWVRRADEPRRQAAGKAARTAISRLEALLASLEEGRDGGG